MGEGAGLVRGEGLKWCVKSLARPSLRIVGMLSSVSRQGLAGPGVEPLMLAYSVHSRVSLSQQKATQGSF